MSSDQVSQQTRNSPHEEIALRAYRLWEARGCPIASPEEDWLRAEEEIRSEQADRDEVVRARNKLVRSHRSAPEADSSPPFSDHSGQL
jgi:hypothetical protein